MRHYMGNTINLSGSGGVGTGGNNYGVNVDLTVDPNSINFTNIVGGSGGSNNYGVNFATSLILVSGSVNFLNVAGGGTSGSTNNYGINIGAQVSAPVITGADIAGGPGTNLNYGLNIAAQLGSTATNVLIMTATSMGNGSNEYGINIGGPVVVGSGATLTFTGSGGGVYNGTGTDNHGIYINNSSITSSGVGATPCRSQVWAAKVSTPMRVSTSMPLV